MKRFSPIAGTAVLAVAMFLNLAYAAASTVFPVAAKDKDKAQTRSLTGTVIDRSEAPLPNAVVYLKNTRTLAVKTYIVSEDGVYRFHALSPNVDYEVYAELNGMRSSTKTLSSFDNRSAVSINLRIDAKK